MPVYEYQCAKCGKEFEMMRSRAEKDAQAKCPVCGKSHVQRKMTTCFMRSHSKEGSSSRVGGASGCASCQATSCRGCQGH